MARKRTVSTLVLIGVVVAIVALAATAFAQGRTGGWQRDGGGEGRGPGERGQAQAGQRGTMGDMNFLERSWTALCFQIETTDEQFEKLWELYKEVLTTRNAAIKAAIESGDMQAYRQAGVDAKAALDAGLPEMLTEEQKTELDTLLQPTVGAGRGGAPWGEGQRQGTQRGQGQRQRQ